MSPVFVEHPTPWIGVPESWPYNDWQSVDEWADELVESLRERFDHEEEGQSEVLRGLLITVAESRVSRNVSRVYIGIENWTGPVTIADLTVVDFAPGESMSLEHFAGVDDPDAVEKPIVDEFVTSSGLQGLESIRYLNPHDLSRLVARLDFVFPTPTGVVHLYTAHLDLVAFERARPQLEALARSISIADSYEDLLASLEETNA